MRRAFYLTLCALLACGDDDTTRPDAAVVSCDDGVFCNGAETERADGRCVAGTPPCAETTRCVERARTCASDCTISDADGDGAEATECGGLDCDDSDAERSPSQTEICDSDGRDEDCDPTTVGVRDADGDGFTSSLCCNGERCGDDCDDARAAAHPGVVEVCNLRDDDCDGSVDEEVALEGYADRDADLHGDPEAPLSGCAGWAGISSTNLDCDDDDPTRHGAQVEVRDGVDNDCDSNVDEMPGAVTWYRDADGDGYGDASAPTTTSDEPVAGHVRLGNDCDDADATRTPATPERCNGRDDDCDARTTFRLGLNDDEDDDGDGYADMRCTDVPMAERDCDDTDGTRNPGAPERCDGRDDDCDGLIDERCDEPADAGVAPCTDACDSPRAVVEDCGCTVAGESCAPITTTVFRCAPRGARRAGESCVVSADCASAHECRDGRCVALCTAIDDPCPDVGRCSRTLSPFAYFSSIPAGLGICTDACDPMEDTGCPAALTCGVAATEDGFYPYCRELSGTNLSVGSECGVSADCERGTFCEILRAGDPRRCVRACPGECPAGFDCSTPAVFEDGTPFTACLPL